MNRLYIRDIQNKVIELLGEGDGLPFSSKDQCSEISRLVGSWVMDDLPEAEITILKGENVLGRKGRCHDILLAGLRDSSYIIDPTIWQFFDDSDNILVGGTKNIEGALEIVEKMYGGEWKVSEKMKGVSEEDRAEWLRIIRGNSKELY